MSEFERGERINAILRSWNPEAERLKDQIERAREKLRWMRHRYQITDGAPMFERDSVLIDVGDLDDILSEDASDANETQDSEGSA